MAHHAVAGTVRLRSLGLERGWGRLGWKGLEQRRLGTGRTRLANDISCCCCGSCRALLRCGDRLDVGAVVLRVVRGGSAALAGHPLVIVLTPWRGDGEARFMLVVLGSSSMRLWCAFRGCIRNVFFRLDPQNTVGSQDCPIACASLSMRRISTKMDRPPRQLH